ncbi:P-loop NTPase [Xanthomonas perforans]
MQSREYAKLTNAFPLSATRPEPLGPVRTIAVTGGKGGVGKTNISANLAVALADMGKRTLLLDADLGLANLDVVLGLAPKYTLADLIAGRCTLDEVIIEGPGGVLVVPAASGRRHMAELAPAQHIGLVNVFSELERDLDVMVIDTAAGITDSVLTFCQAAQDTVVVVCDEPASITDASAMTRAPPGHPWAAPRHSIATLGRHPNDGRGLQDTLPRVCKNVPGGVARIYPGLGPQDAGLRLGVRHQHPSIRASPASPSAQAIAEIARRTSRWQAPTVPRGNVEFFVERIIQRGVAA